MEHWDRSPRKLANAVVLEILKTRLASSSLSVRRTDPTLTRENGEGGLCPSQSVCYDAGKLSSAPQVASVFIRSFIPTSLLKLITIQKYPRPAYFVLFVMYPDSVQNPGLEGFPPSTV